MVLKVDLTLDCVRAAEQAVFWKLALGYEDEPPPAPFTSREEWVASFGPPEEDEGDGAWLHDPSGVGPRLTLLEVPEPKVAKNRLHLDIRVPGGWGPVQVKVAELTAAGATAQTGVHDGS